MRPERGACLHITVQSSPHQTEHNGDQIQQNININPKKERMTFLFSCP